jgi:hypothetical protein
MATSADGVEIYETLEDRAETWERSQQVWLPPGEPVYIRSYTDIAHAGTRQEPLKQHLQAFLNQLHGSKVRPLPTPSPVVC